MYSERITRSNLYGYIEVLRNKVKLANSLAKAAIKIPFIRQEPVYCISREVIKHAADAVAQEILDAKPRQR